VFGGGQGIKIVKQCFPTFCSLRPTFTDNFCGT